MKTNATIVASIITGIVSIAGSVIGSYATIKSKALEVQKNTDQVSGQSAKIEDLYRTTLAKINEDPIGTIVAFGGVLKSIPPGWLYCDGSSKPVKDYSDLANSIADKWGANNGIEFTLPDLRGYFLRGVDDNTGTDPEATNRKKPNGKSGGDVGSVQL